MAEKKGQAAARRKRGAIYLAIWAVLICTGIVAKRVYGHPDLMVFFHLPAAVCLVMGGHQISWKIRQRYKEELAARQRTA